LTLWNLDFNLNYWKHKLVELPRKSFDFDLNGNTICIGYCDGSVQ
jgi:hypothetical protein